MTAKIKRITLFNDWSKEKVTIIGEMIIISFIFLYKWTPLFSKILFSFIVNSSTQADQFIFHLSYNYNLLDFLSIFMSNFNREENQVQLSA